MDPRHKLSIKNILIGKNKDDEITGVTLFFNQDPTTVIEALEDFEAAYEDDKDKKGAKDYRYAVINPANPSLFMGGKDVFELLEKAEKFINDVTYKVYAQIAQNEDEIAQDKAEAERAKKFNQVNEAINHLASYIQQKKDSKGAGTDKRKQQESTQLREAAIHLYFSMIHEVYWYRGGSQNKQWCEDTNVVLKKLFPLTANQHAKKYIDKIQSGKFSFDPKYSKLFLALFVDMGKSGEAVQAVVKTELYSQANMVQTGPSARRKK